jgi:hypothetical protein
MPAQKLAVVEEQNWAFGLDLFRHPSPAVEDEPAAKYEGFRVIVPTGSILDRLLMAS